MTSSAATPDAPNATTEAASAVTFGGLEGGTWDALLIWALAIAALAAAAVVATTTGSIVTHKRETEAAERSLDRYKTTVDGRIADARTEGLAAGRTAGDALVRAAQANERAAALEKDAAQAREREAQARVEQEKLRASNLSLQQQIARVQGAVASRRLSRDRGAAMIEVLRSVPRPVPVRIQFPGDAEAAQYASDIGHALTDAGAQVTMDGGGMIIPQPYGVIVSGKPQNVVFEALTAAGIDFQARLTDLDVPDIMVGLKPPRM